MHSASEVAGLPAPTNAASDLGPSLTEAAAEVTRLLASARSRIPAELLTAHLVRCHGTSDFPLLRAAAEATLRRLRIVEEERLKVSRHPPQTRGFYQTTRKGRAQRPYATRLYGLEPLDGSCDCPDFRGNSLGLCKHLLAVLDDLHKRASRRKLAQARGHQELDVPTLRWQPQKPLLGDGDWLRQIELHWPAGAERVAAPWRRLRALCEAGRNPARLAEVHRDDATSRSRLLDVLQDALEIDIAQTGADPALLANLAEERRRLANALEMAPLCQRRGTLPGFRRALFPYQREGVARFLQNGRLLLADDMGLGKTTQAIAAIFTLVKHDYVRRGLLVVPASLKQQWQREWQACCDLPLTIVEGSPEQREKTYRTTKRGILVANYEQLLRDLEVVQRWQPDLVLLDEAQRMKNWATRTAKTVKQLEPRFRFVLTGTPFENRILELDSLLEWLDRAPLQPLWRFAPVHQIPEGGGLRHLDTLRERLAPILLRRRRQEVLDQLPSRTDTRIDVPLTDAQREEHDARILPIAALMRAAERRPLTQGEFLRLMQLFTEQRILTNGMGQFVFEEVWPGIQKVHPDPALLDCLSMPKLGELRLLLEQIAVEQGRKVVVFSQWLRALQLAGWAIGPMLAAAGLRAVFFTGAESLRRRTENVVAFHDDPATRVLFCTDAGGVGLNLQMASSCVVHFDLPWNPAVFEQRVGRVWRLGQKHKVDVYSLVGDHCIESRIALLLRGKQAAFSALFDGESDEVRFDQQSGFLATARRVAGVEAMEEGGEGAAVVDAADAVGSASEAGAAVASAPVPTQKPVPVGSATAPTVPERPPIDAHRVRSLLAGLSVAARADGGMVIQADREAASVLAEVLRGLANAIDGAAG
jgi:superfamily II DNA or RNA helicase